MNDFLVADEQSMFEAKVKEKRETFHDDDDFASSNKPFFSLNLGERREKRRPESKPESHSLNKQLNRQKHPFDRSYRGTSVHLF